MKVTVGAVSVTVTILVDHTDFSIGKVGSTRHKRIKKGVQHA